MPIDRPRSPLSSFIQHEAAGGILLMAAAALAIVAANTDASEAYFRALDTNLGPLSMQHWVNDALMAGFFLLLGLEVKREFTVGRLATWPERRLPIIAAAAGMLVPAATYLAAVGGSTEMMRGWAIPTATDPAFAIAIFALVGRRAPPSLALLLTTIAVVDDVIAVAVIALVYTASISFVAIGAAAVIMLLMVALNRSGESRLWVYGTLAIPLWLAVYLSGVHATLAGVLVASTIPVRSRDHRTGSPLERMEHVIRPWVIYGVVPLFGFANSGVTLIGLSISHLFTPLAGATAIGLFVGKQLGVFASLRIAVAIGIGARPSGASWLQVYAMAVLCGIGFTISLFIGALAFDEPTMIDQVKIGVLAASVLSMFVGYAILRFANQPLIASKG